MRITLDLSDPRSYELFLRVKGLPRYRFVGREAIIPDEYAGRLGIAAKTTEDHPYQPIAGLFDYQRDIAAMAIRKRKFAVFAEPGLGKTLMMLEFARHAEQALGVNGNVLIVSPPMVIPQTIAEAARFYGDRLKIRRVRASELAGWITNGTGIGITNYEGLKDQVPQGRLGALLLDESSLLKSHYGKWGQECIRLGRGLDWKLALTGTPAPNDRIEYANHAVFLDAFPTVNSFLARFFVNRGQTDNRWELKPHALRPFYRALSHWCIFLTNPVTYGWKDNAGTIPPIYVHVHDVDLTDAQNAAVRKLNGSLFTNHVGGIGNRSKLARIAKTGDSHKPTFIRSLIESWPGESTLVWCRFNDEQDRLAAELPGSASISGDTPEDERERIVAGFQNGEIRTLISKSKILGFGLNLQVCTRQVFSSCHDCYDEKTEILTGDGWKSFGEIDYESDIATVNPSTLDFEWQKPTRVIWSHYSGPMVRFVGQRNFDLLVTPNHRMFVKRCGNRFPGDKAGWHFRYATEIAENFRSKELRMRSCPAGFSGETPGYIENEYSPRSDFGATKTISRLATRDAVQLAAWYLTEGYCRPEGTPEFGRITICQTEKNPENRDEIIALLCRIAGHVDSKTKDIKCYSRHLASWLIGEFGHGSYNKRMPRWLKELDRPSLAILRDTMLRGDGISDGMAYRTASLGLANDFQEVCLKTGVRASVKRRVGACAAYPEGVVYDVNLAREFVEPSIHVPPGIEDYEGMIGCVTVPNGVVIVRRNGIPCVSGNSYEEFFQSVKRSNRVGSTRPLNVHLPVTEAERPMMENVLRKAHRVERDTQEQEELFKNAS
jgi:hypothetical protein